MARLKLNRSTLCQTYPNDSSREETRLGEVKAAEMPLEAPLGFVKAGFVKAGFDRRRRRPELQRNM